MAENTFTLNVELQTRNTTAALNGLQKELKQTADAAKDIGKGFTDGLKGIDTKINDLSGSLKDLTTGGIRGVSTAIIDLTSGMGLAAGSISAVALAAVAGTAALIANSSALAAAADDAAELAQKYGITTTELATFNLIAKENGTTTAALIGTYDKLSNSLSDLEDDNLKVINAFRALGIMQADLANKSKEQIAGMVIRNLNALGNTAQATAAAQDILGKSFRETSVAALAAADSIGTYQQRVQGTVASKELEEAGAAQEKAFSDLGLEIDRLRINLSRLFRDSATDAANWGTTMARGINNVIKTYANANVALSEVIDIEREEFGKLSLIDRFSVENQREVNRRIQERVAALSSIRQAANEAAAATERLNNFKGTSTAGAGRGSVNPPLVKLAKEDTDPKRLSEAERNALRLRDAIADANSDIKRQLEILAVGSDAAAIAVINLAHKLFDAGKGIISYEDALKKAKVQTQQFQDIVEKTNTKKLNDSIKSINDDLALQLQILTATTEKDKEQLRVRAQLSKLFENQPGGAATEAQLRAVEAAAKGAADQIERISQQRINNSVRDSMRDLTEQSRDLAFELDHFWDVNRAGLVDTNAALQALYRQIDPEGRGDKITTDQKAQLESQLKVIDAQKRLIQQNQMIEQSFQDLGSAVSDWALDSENGIKRVKIELLKLIALSALRAYGTTGNSFADLFIGGMVQGLSGSRASGGPVQAGRPYRVGEQGAETVMFNQAGYVMPNEQTRVSTKSGGLVVSVNPVFQNHGTINSTEDLDGYMQKWGEGVARHTEKFVREQFSATGMAYMR